MNRLPHVTIIVLNYNQRDFTLQCLRSLQNLAYPDYELVLVDNASSDGSLEAFRACRLKATLLNSGANLGFCGGNNIGIRYALKHGTPYIHLLNPDTLLVNPQYLRELIGFLEQNSRYGIAGPKVFWQDIATVQRTVLRFPSLWRGILTRLSHGSQRSPPGFLPFALGGRKGQVERCAGNHTEPAMASSPELAPGTARSGSHCGSAFRGERDAGERKARWAPYRPTEVDAINGVCAVIRAQVFQDVGFLDERMFMYADEIEFAWRACLAGWRSCYLPVPSVLHLRGGSTGPASNSSFLVRRNTIYVLQKMGHRNQAWVYAGFSLLLLGFRAFWNTLQRRDGHEYWRAWLRLARAYQLLLFSDRMEMPGNALNPPALQTR